MPRVESTSNIPKSELQKKINRYKADPDYISHTVTQEDAGGKLWTLDVTLKDLKT